MVYSQYSYGYYSLRGYFVTDFKKKYEDLLLEYKVDRLCRDLHVASLRDQITFLQNQVNILEETLRKKDIQKVNPYLSWRAR